MAMDEIKYYLCGVYEQQQVTITEYRNLAQLVTDWQESEHKNYTAVTYLAFKKPQLTLASKLQKIKGSLLLCPAIQQLLPLSYQAIDQPSLKLKVNNKVASFCFALPEALAELTTPPTKKAQGWLRELPKIAPDLATELLPYKVLSDADYLKIASKLDLEIRNRFDYLRYQYLHKSINIKNTIEFIKILPESIRQLDIKKLGLKTRITNIFQQNAIEKLADLDNLSLIALRKWPNFGSRSIDQIYSHISENIETIIEQINNFSHLEKPIKELSNRLFSEKFIRLNLIAKDTLLNNFELSLAKLSDRDRYIFESRIGYKYKLLTLKEIATKLHISSERVRQIQNKTILKIKTKELWVDYLNLKIKKLITSRSAPLFLNQLAEEHPWFAGFNKKTNNLSLIIKYFSSSEISLININKQLALMYIYSKEICPEKKQVNGSLKSLANEALVTVGAGLWELSGKDLSVKNYL